MGKKSDRETRFTENLERLLAGETVNIDPSLDKELAETLDFAKMLAQLGSLPSLSYQSQLKTRLLQKLAEQEAKKEQRWVWLRSLISQPVWQAVGAAVFIIIVGSIIWATVLQKPTTPIISPAPGTSPSVSTPRPDIYLTAEVSTNKATYRPGEAVIIDLVIRNSGNEPFKIDQFPPILSLMQTDTKQPVYTFAAGNGVVILNPEESVRRTLTWDQRDFQGKQVSRGSFHIELEDLEFQQRPVPLNLSHPARFDIKPF